MPRITEESGDSDSSDTEVKRPLGDDDETGVQRPATENIPLLRNRRRDYSATGTSGTSGTGPVAVRPRSTPIVREPINWRHRRSMFQNPYILLRDGRVLHLGVDGWVYDQYPESQRWRDHNDYVITLAVTIICFIFMVIMVTGTLVHKSFNWPFP